jgi:hypothetical protein
MKNSKISFTFMSISTKFAPKIKSTTSNFNDKNDLIVKTENEQEYESLESWPTNRSLFNHGIQLIERSNKRYLALHRVSPNLNIEDPKVKQHLWHRPIMASTMLCE